MAWWKYARVGQKVVAIEQAFSTIRGAPPFPLKIGAEYTIRDIGFNQDIADRGLCDGIWINVGVPGHRYAAILFRPLSDTTKAVEALKRLTLNTPEKVGEGVMGKRKSAYAKYRRCKKCHELVVDPDNCANCANSNPLSATTHPQHVDGKRGRPTLDIQEGNWEEWQ